MKENEEKTDESTSDCRDTNDWRFGQDGGEEVEIHYSGKIIKDHMNLIEIFDASPYPSKTIGINKLQFIPSDEKIKVIENSPIIGNRLTWGKISIKDFPNLKIVNSHSDQQEYFNP